ncbi:GNAT family N-acetyltransferase [Dyadobacter fanqingshengii]|uniref:GNAT family N-acetyltransferase n=1 Tax=Dyadobacter fanqingshengii TaxID=2906443 RepID=A0A9X1PCQ7_9BACT|nr:GNAT family N-acetyltransferase [Dyadobacter fanqingshengii]MCF0042115.1 GNAT family N-acetyltransferase [Dyadobacter fanqingshengii]USJ35350.1 GNAT family N-acetyltransferase [Dyadobacter fanqingshengii]
MSDQLTFAAYKGVEIAAVVEALGALRIAVFHDYPYLYEGSLDYEKDYLQIYVQSERAFLFSVFDGSKMVGATTCIPLTDEAAEVRKPFEDAGFDISTIFYFGESILLPEYRGSGLGHRFFDEREAHARSFGNFELSCFCSVERGDNHPAKPADYRPNDAFWLKRGYVKEPALQSIMEWPDIGETSSSAKNMTFWIKPLNS